MAGQKEKHKKKTFIITKKKQIIKKNSNRSNAVSESDTNTIQETPSSIKEKRKKIRLLIWNQTIKHIERYPLTVLSYKT